MRRLLVVLVATSCGTLQPLPDGGTTGSGFVLPQLPPPQNLALFASIGAGSTRLLAEVANARVEIDPTQRDALTALGECADLLSYCYAPPNLTLARCFASVKGCATQTPWTEPACCPAACRDAFTREVAAGLPPNAALDKVLFAEPDCFPGVRAALEAP
ncbi:MAG: hypothetical protein Q8S33_09385 [Myxococcales bacterium]|nr:hypothetical protein [Myxococcales bacterium]